MPVVTKRATAKRDLIDHFVYLAENASVDVADRFLANAEATFSVLGQQPSMGAPLKLRHPDLTGMRKWRVMDFEKILIFYARVLTAYQLYAYYIQRKTGGRCSGRNRSSPPNSNSAHRIRPVGQFDIT